MRLSRPLFSTLLASTLLSFGSPPSAFSQEIGEEGWWPHPRWGAEDQAGGSNWITSAKVLEAIELVEEGRIYELSHVYEPGMPVFPGRTYSLYIPSFPTGGPIGEDLVYNDELVIGEIGQVGTQFDGPGHIGRRVVADDGEVELVFYNGVRGSEMKGAYGLRKLGVEHVGPYITRGVLIDVAGYKNVETLPESYVVTLEDVVGALNEQGLSEDDIRPGDAILFNFGWWRLWPDPRVMSGTWPGIGHEVADWIVEQEASMVGSDAATDEASRWVVHRELIVEHGIFNLELMDFEELLEDPVYQFMFVFTPLRLKGATGSPGRPLAIR